MLFDLKIGSNKHHSMEYIFLQIPSHCLGKTYCITPIESFIEIHLKFHEKFLFERL